MRMGNYLSLKPVVGTVMAATESTFGMRHPTVVPTNFESTAESADDEETAADPSADTE